MSEAEAKAKAAYRVENVELSLDENSKDRREILRKISTVQKELDDLVKKGLRRPREKIPELEERLKKLEHDRTIVSIPLKQEKEILWQMSRVEKRKHEVQEFAVHDQQVKLLKTELTKLRNDLKVLGERISELRVELSMARKAKELGCSMEELVGMQLDCPQDKMGVLIGKKGQNVKQLEKKEHVSIDVANKEGSVRLIGSLASLNATASSIDRLLSRVDENVDIPKSLVSFLTSKGIRALSEIRGRNPDVEFDMTRSTGATVLRGVPDDILSAKNDLLSFEIVEKRLSVPGKESAAVVGKNGATITDLVARHQSAIEVIRSGESDGSDAAVSSILILGPISCVKEAVYEIEDILAQHKEEIQTISIDPVLKEILLKNKGVGMQAIAKLVNDGCRDILPGSPGSVNVSIDGLAVKIKGRALLMPIAVQIASDEIRLKESSIVRLKVHPCVIPALIGKGGSSISKLKEGAENAVVEVDRSTGRVAICSLDDPADTEKVVQSIKEFITNNQVKLVDLEPQQFQNQFRLLLKTPYWKKLIRLVTVSRSDEMFQIQLRGSAKNVEKAAEVLTEFLDNHYQDEIPVTQEDYGALLKGGKNGKIEKLSREHGVTLSLKPEKSIVLIIGRKERIHGAKKAIDHFLNGGEGVTISRVEVDVSSVGVLVGKGGNTKASTEAKFPTLSISLPPNQTIVVLRGPEHDVEACKKYLAKLLTIAITSVRLPMDEKMLEVSKSVEVRDKVKSLPIQANFEDDHVLLQGLRADVNYAAAFLSDVAGGTYENRVFLDASCFKKFYNSNRDALLSDIQNGTRTKIDMDQKSSSISFRGKKENVITAKSQLFQFLGFLLSDFISFEPVPDHALKLFGQPVRLGSIAEESGAFVYLDRDIKGVVISSHDPECIARARDVTHKRILSLDRLMCKLDLGKDGEWLAPVIIGKGGSKIKLLRKNLDCTITVVHNVVTLMNEDPEKLRVAKETMENIIAEEKTKCLSMDLPNEKVSAFLGDKGSNVMEFEKLHHVQVKATRREQDSHLRITGSVGAVAGAKIALDAWLHEEQGNDRAADVVALYNFEPPESELLRRLIGKNGNRINALRRRCKSCRIEINVDNLTLKIISSDNERLETAKILVNRILEEERSQNALISISNEDLPAFIGSKGSNIRAFEQSHNVKVQVLKSEAGAINISGKAEDIVGAKDALNAWLSGRSDNAKTISKEEAVRHNPEQSRNGKHPPKPPRNNTRKPGASKTFTGKQQNTDFPALSVAPTEETIDSAFSSTSPEKNPPTNTDSDQTSQSWSQLVRNPSKES